MGKQKKRVFFLTTLNFFFFSKCQVTWNSLSPGEFAWQKWQTQKSGVVWISVCKFLGLGQHPWRIERIKDQGKDQTDQFGEMMWDVEIVIRLFSRGYRVRSGGCCSGLKMGFDHPSSSPESPGLTKMIAHRVLVILVRPWTQDSNGARNYNFSLVSLLVFSTELNPETWASGDFLGASDAKSVASRWTANGGANHGLYFSGCPRARARGWASASLQPGVVEPLHAASQSNASTNPRAIPGLVRVPTASTFFCCAGDRQIWRTAMLLLHWISFGTTIRDVTLQWPLSSPFLRTHLMTS